MCLCLRVYLFLILLYLVGVFTARFSCLYAQTKHLVFLFIEHHKSYPLHQEKNAQKVCVELLENESPRRIKREPT